VVDVVVGLLARRRRRGQERRPETELGAPTSATASSASSSDSDAVGTSLEDAFMMYSWAQSFRHLTPSRIRSGLLIELAQIPMEG
jgi:hypothetical protein